MQTQRREALNVAKAAVRAYARDPSAANAIEVDVAWRRVRALDDVEPWRSSGARRATDPVSEPAPVVASA
ncbi:MAG: hypothetical protein AAF637_20930 [Pseudomonadota bacterium]